MSAGPPSGRLRRLPPLSPTWLYAAGIALVIGLALAFLWSWAVSGDGGILQAAKNPVRLRATIWWGQAVILTLALAGGLALHCSLVPLVRREIERRRAHADARSLEEGMTNRTRELEQAHAERDRKAREADTLLEIAQATRSTANEQELFQHIARGAAAALRVDRCTIYLFDESGAWVTPAVSQFEDGTVDLEMWQAFKALGKLRLNTVPFLHEAARRREPVMIEQAAADPRVPRSWAEMFRLKALLVVPLIYRSRVTGLLTFDYTRDDCPITPQQIHLAASLAEQVALAIQNARLYTDAETRRREAEVVAELAAAVNASLDLDTVLRRVTEAAKELCQSEVAAIALRDPDSEAMLLRYHIPTWGRNSPDDPGEPGNAEALVGGHPVLANDPEPRHEYATVMQREGVVAVMVVPIRSEQGAEGLLYVGNHSPRPFSSHDKAILTRLADHAAIAIRNSRLYREAQTRLARMTRATELSRLINSSLDYQRVLDFVTGATLELLNGDMACLWVADEAASVLRLAAAKERAAVTTRATPVAEFPLGHGLVGWVVQNKTKRYTANLLTDSLLTAKEWVRAMGYTSQLAVPLVVGEQAVGALAVLTKVPRRFSGEEEELLELFAAQAATALENARLYQQTQQAYERLEETQNHLAHAQKMEAVGRLAGGVAHDFNNLLTIIKGRTDLLRGHLASDDRLSRQLELISTTSDRAAALTRQLLALSRRQLRQPKILDLNAVVTETGKMLESLIGEDIELVTASDGALGSVRADPGQIEQVIMNLAVNARDAMPHGGTLRIETANVELDEAYARHQVGIRPGAYVRLEVRDTGVGISDEIRSRIFEPFFTTKAPGKGTGLGLATVYAIVQQSAGHIEVESAPRQGAAFRIYLPRIETAVESTDAAAPAGPRRGTETVLLVEDEEDVRALARDILVGHGYTVMEAAKGDEALLISQQREGPIHLLLTDVVMPQMNGRELADGLAPARPEMKVLYMSGYADEVIGHCGVLEPGIAFLAKPFTADALASKVREVLDGAALPAAALTI
ncbi:MAG: GAF domain-containing protein [Candidatus Rokubacteria bacterium]|nr:GAF domain-containing protein [Candidatus Rokubacteria bacterium]